MFHYILLLLELESTVYIVTFAFSEPRLLACPSSPPSMESVTTVSGQLASC